MFREAVSQSSGRFLAVVNPAAGGGRGGRRATAALERLRRAGLDLEVVETAVSGDATRIARQGFSSGYRHFIAAGGDGTNFEVLNGFLPGALDARERVSLGLLPLGTGNSLLRDFSDRGTEFAIEALADGRSRPCDVLRLHHRDGVLYYINLLGVGFPARVASLVNRRFKPLGRISYSLGVLSSLVLLDYPRIPVRWDGGHLVDAPVTFVTISNSRYTANGMLIAPGADIQDGRADLVRVQPLGRWALVRAFPTIFKGTHVKLPSVTVAQAERVDFELSAETDVLVDGEVLRLQPRFVEVVKSALDLRV